MDAPDFDQLLRNYHEAVDRWVDAIRAEESLATDDHSMVQMERWDDAGFKLHDAELTAKKARDAYKNALRKKNYGFYGWSLRTQLWFLRTNKSRNLAVAA